MCRAGKVVLDKDGAVHVAADRVDGAQRDGPSDRRLVLRGFEDGQASDPLSGRLARALRATQVAEQGASKGEEDQVQESDERQLSDQDQDAEGLLRRHPWIPNSMVVLPT